MISTFFHAPKNIKILKDVIEESLKKELNIKEDFLHQYEQSFLETMKYVEENSPKEIPRGINKDEYLLKLNKKVYQLYTPILKEKVVKDQQQKQYQEKYELRVPPRNIPISTQSERVQPKPQTIVPTNRVISSQQQRKPVEEDRDRQFDPILMNNYDNIQIMEYPRPPPDMMKINEESSKNVMMKLQNERDLLEVKPKEVDFRDQKSLNIEQSKEFMMNQYSELAKQYENGIQQPYIPPPQEEGPSFEAIPLDSIDMYEEEEEIPVMKPNHFDIEEKPRKRIQMKIEEQTNIEDKKQMDSLQDFHFKEEKKTKQKNKVSFEEDLSKKEVQSPIKPIEYSSLIQQPIQPLYDKLSPNRDNILFSGNSLELPKKTLSPPIQDIPIQKYQKKNIILDTMKRDYLKMSEIYDYGLEVGFKESDDRIRYDTVKDKKGNVLVQGIEVEKKYKKTNRIPIQKEKIEKISVKRVYIPNESKYVGGRGPLFYSGGEPLSKQDNFHHHQKVTTHSTGIEVNEWNKQPFIMIGDIKMIEKEKTEEYRIYEPIEGCIYERGKKEMDKISLKIQDCRGKQMFIGKDWYYIERIFRGSKKYSPISGEEYDTTCILLKNQDKDYEKWIRENSNQKEPKMILNHHGIQPGDKIQIHKTYSFQVPVLFFTELMKTRLEESEDGLYYYLLFYYQTDVIKYIFLKDILPQGENIYQYYMVLKNKKKNVRFKIEENIENHKIKIEKKKFDKYFGGGGVEEIERMGILRRVREGYQEDERYQIHDKVGYYVSKVGNFTNVSQLKKEENQMWYLEIDYPYGNLSKDLREDEEDFSMMQNDYFLVEEKRQIFYEFDVEYDL